MTVRRILNASNPKLASGLRGIVTTVEQLVKVGSLIEKDWGNSKEYWCRVQQHNPADRSSKKFPKKAVQGQSSGHSADLASVLGAPTLLVVPVAIRGSRGDAVLDTGCTYSLMSSTLWTNIKKAGEALGSECQRFVMANGQESKAVGKATLLLTLNNAHYTVNVYVLDDHQLCMPLLLGLDFMRTSQLTLRPHLGKYVMPGAGNTSSCTRPETHWSGAMWSLRPICIWPSLNISATTSLLLHFWRFNLKWSGRCCGNGHQSGQSPRVPPMSSSTTY